ncbi:hypothetical protein EYF80_029104 [Liparis tanakae]|uniref:Uncharacterized protein n=1 Tax=Liparis tanakae TaxID=230148 RepID=A0A4Z2H4S5_9TELE|nr:hypothetical protein EYF80_029104 [Liparis tanakae]
MAAESKTHHLVSTETTTRSPQLNPSWRQFTAPSRSVCSREMMCIAAPPLTDPWRQQVKRCGLQVHLIPDENRTMEICEHRWESFIGVSVKLDKCRDPLVQLKMRESIMKRVEALPEDNGGIVEFIHGGQASAS